MEIKVRAVDGAEQKSVQQVENELLEKHEAKVNSNESETTELEVKEETVKNEPKAEEPKVNEEIKTQSSELNEEDVLKFMSNKYGREISSLDELTQPQEQKKEELPEDVSKYLSYKKETGRGFDDFMKLQKDFESVDDDTLLRDYLTATEKGLDADDIDIMIESDYSFDEDLDDEKDIKKAKLRKKKVIAKAKEYFAEQQEQYKVPLESRRDEANAQEAEELEAYRNYIAEAKTVEESNKRKQEVFMKKTDDVFTEFKGFEFDLDGNKLVFNPGDAAEIKSAQLNPQTFIQKFLGEDGVIKDAAGYHRSLAMAMQPEKFANFFYEQGKSAAVDESMRDLKNVNMSTRQVPEVTKTGGMQIKSASQDSGRGLKIKSKRKS